MNRSLVSILMISRLLRFALVFGLVSMFTAAGAWAQITINASDLRSEFIRDQTFTSMTYGVTDLIPVSPLVNNTDGPYDWTGLTFTDPDVFDVEIRTSFSGLPGAADFSTADFVQITVSVEQGDSTISYAYNKIADDGLFLLGVVAIGDFDGDGQDDESRRTSSPTELLLPLPLSEGTTRQQDFERTMTTGGVTVTLSISKTWNADGSGTLRTPDGDAESVRVQETEEVTVFGITTTLVRITYASHDDVTADIGLDGTGLVIAAGYTKVDKGGGGATALERSAEVPDAIALEQNYPNPFNPTTTIGFSLSETGHVTLHVYDVLGRQVATLVDESLATGAYTIDFQAEDLPSGVYLYKLHLGSTVLTRRLLLLK